MRSTYLVDQVNDIFYFCQFVSDYRNIRLEKYLAVCFPFWYEKYVTKARVGNVIVAIAVIITVIAFLFPISQTSSAPFHVFIFLVIFVAFSIFLWCQGKIFIVLSRIRSRIFTEPRGWGGGG